MPELPEIETLVRQLRESVLKKSFEDVRVHRASVIDRTGWALRTAVCGRDIRSVRRAGKYLALELEDRGLLWFHMGMSGQLILAARLPGALSHVHLEFLFKGGGLLYYRDPRRFGRVFYQAPAAASPSALRFLGPDPFQVSAGEFAGVYQGRKARIKSLLLDQRLVSGLGNIYADESLFRAGIDPRKRASHIHQERLKALHARVCETLKEAVSRGGSTIGDYRHVNGASGRFQDLHRVYGREKQPCRSCAAGVRRVVISGRSSYFCPVCQKD